MAADLETRLEPLANKRTLVLTHYGRKSGKPYQVTICFVVQGNKVYLSTPNKNRQWVRNVQKTPKVQLAIGGRTFTGTARFLVDPAEHHRALGLVTRKYWMFTPIFAPWYLLKRVGLVRDHTGSFEVTLSSLLD